MMKSRTRERAFRQLLSLMWAVYLGISNTASPTISLSIISDIFVLGVRHFCFASRVTEYLILRSAAHTQPSLIFQAR